MALKDIWINKIDDVDDADAEDINMVAGAVIDLEEQTGNIEIALENIIAIQNELIGGDSV